MARTWVIGAALVIGAVGGGCKNSERNPETPRSMRGSPPPDAPGYTIEEQERRGRARYAIGEDDFRIGPKTYADRPDPISGGINR